MHKVPLEPIVELECTFETKVTLMGSLSIEREGQDLKAIPSFSIDVQCSKRRVCYLFDPSNTPYVFCYVLGMDKSSPETWPESGVLHRDNISSTEINEDVAVFVGNILYSLVNRWVHSHLDDYRKRQG